MKTVHHVARNRRLRDTSVWQLLAADNAPFTLGVLEFHLGGGDSRLSASVLVERLRRDLDQLRAEGHDLPQSAEAYLAQWLRAGYLERRYAPGASEEEYELTTDAARAIQFVQGLSEQRLVATESRLSLVIEQLDRLAEQTETDPERRIESLERERDRLDARIEAVRKGEIESLSRERALERAREVIALADELANDFRRVRDEFRQLNRDLREQVLESEGSRGDVLEKLFAGVDVIGESEAGRTFKAFWALLTDTEQSTAFETALEQVLSRDFAQELTRDDRRFLLQLTRLLLQRGGEVHDVFQHFARGLKQFVQSREYQEQRRLTRLLKRAQNEAVAIKDHVRPTDPIGRTLYLTSAGIRSLAQWRLYDPGLDRVVSTISKAEEADISLEMVGDLLQQSEIDFHRLERQLDELLSQHAQVTVGHVLEVYPAEQGLGSVVGLLALGVRRGFKSAQQERVSWVGRDGVARSARIPRIHFTRELAHGQS